MIYKVEEILDAVNEICDSKKNKLKKLDSQPKTSLVNNGIPPETNSIISDAEAFLTVKKPF